MGRSADESECRASRLGRHGTPATLCCVLIQEAPPILRRPSLRFGHAQCTLPAAHLHQPISAAALTPPRARGARGCAAVASLDPHGPLDVAAFCFRPLRPPPLGSDKSSHRRHDPSHAGPTRLLQRRSVFTVPTCDPRPGCLRPRLPDGPSRRALPCSMPPNCPAPPSSTTRRRPPPTAPPQPSPGEASIAPVL